jgi:hypothetical protein
VKNVRSAGQPRLTGDLDGGRATELGRAVGRRRGDNESSGASACRCAGMPAQTAAKGFCSEPTSQAGQGAAASR